MSDYFIFDDIDTRDYEGIYVYFDEVDFTPKRVGEFVEIPNRNGEFFLDGGRYEDVTHTYDVIAVDKEVGRDLINAVASKVGHHRLEDSFNPDEYYSAVFATEVEPTVTPERDKIVFKLMFTRKPQRFLKSGETAITVSSGETITNPTLFDARPMLLINGSGEISINDSDTIRIIGGDIGLCLVAEGKQTQQVSTETFDFDDGLLNVGDDIGGLTGELRLAYYSYMGDVSDFSSSQTGAAGTITCKNIIWYNQRSYHGCGVYCDVNTAPFSYGTPRTDTTSFSGTVPTTNHGDVAISATCTISYNGTHTITMGISATTTLNTWSSLNYVKRDNLYASSSQSILGNPLYIDLDIGEAYKIEGGKVISINDGVIIPASLPKLTAGANTITFDDISELKVVPRWWKV